MIDYVRGQVERVAEGHVVIDVGGVGYRVEATPATVAGLVAGDTRTVPTTLVVREDAWTLYGFRDVDERDVFELVQTVSGVGPRTAQALIGTLGAGGLRTAVAQEDAATIMTVPGIGRKGAQRMLLELGDRLGSLPTRSGEPAATAADPGSWRTTVVSGLISLGWSARDAEAAAQSVAPRAEELRAPDGSPDIAGLLRAALQELTR